MAQWRPKKPDQPNIQTWELSSQKGGSSEPFRVVANTDIVDQVRHAYAQNDIAANYPGRLAPPGIKPAPPGKIRILETDVDGQGRQCAIKWVTGKGQIRAGRLLLVNTKK
jgi:hypothetical protein